MMQLEDNPLRLILRSHIHTCICTVSSTAFNLIQLHRQLYIQKLIQQQTYATFFKYNAHVRNRDSMAYNNEANMCMPAAAAYRCAICAI